MDNQIYLSATVIGKREITIPKKVCDLLQIESGDNVVFREKGDSIIFEKGVHQYTRTISANFKYDFIIRFL